MEKATPKRRCQIYQNKISTFLRKFIVIFPDNADNLHSVKKTREMELFRRKQKHVIYDLPISLPQPRFYNLLLLMFSSHFPPSTNAAEEKPKAKSAELKK